MAVKYFFSGRRNPAVRFISDAIEVSWDNLNYPDHGEEREVTLLSMKEVLRQIEEAQNLKHTLARQSVQDYLAESAGTWQIKIYEDHDSYQLSRVVSKGGGGLPPVMDIIGGKISDAVREMEDLRKDAEMSFEEVCRSVGSFYGWEFGVSAEGEEYGETGARHLGYAWRVTNSFPGVVVTISGFDRTRGIDYYTERRKWGSLYCATH